MSVLILVLLAVVLPIIYVLWLQIKRQKKSQPKHKLDKSLDQQLLTMLHGDHKAALRLLRHARKNHPGQSYLWYHEKVIKDLARDRRS